MFGDLRPSGICNDCKWNIDEKCTVGKYCGKSNSKYEKKEVSGMKHIAEICAELQSTLIRKNTDYGSSATDTYKKYGITSYLTRLTDKMNRLDSLLIGDKEALVEDEKIEDTLTDLAGYCILMLNDIKEHGIIKSNETKEV